MKVNTKKPLTIDDYVAGFPVDVRELLQKIRATIQKAAPQAVEKISYQMPTFYLHGNLVHFALCKEHIGFYPTPSGLQAFPKAIAKYKSSKGAVQFPLDRAIPYGLIAKIVKFRVKENVAKAKSKSRQSAAADTL